MTEGVQGERDVYTTPHVLVTIRTIHY